MLIQCRRDRIVRRLIPGLVFGVAACLPLTSCGGVVYPPTYTQAELRAICERHGGWWRGDLIPGYCEYQAASLTQAP